MVRMEEGGLLQEGRMLMTTGGKKIFIISSNINNAVIREGMFESERRYRG